MSSAASMQDISRLSLIGIFPLLAPSTTLVSGLIMAVAFIMVVLATTLSVSSIRGFIVNNILLPVCLLISAAWVIVLDRFMLACCYQLRELLDFYLLLLAVNAGVLFYLQQYASRAKPVSVLKQLCRPLTVMVSLLLVCAATREWLATGTLHFPFSFDGGEEAGVSSSSGLILFGMAPGAFICLGLILALVNSCLKRASGISVE